jgi:hypothetical protein
MSIEELVAALQLPAAARVDKRVPKALLLENGGPTAADKRAISDGIEALHWLTSLKPTTTGVPAYRDPTREYLEIAVLHLELRSSAKSSRLAELVHRAIPYPVILLADQDGPVSVSLAHKRWALNEGGKIVLDGEVVATSLAGVPSDVVAGFLGALPLAGQSRTNMLALYRGWEDAVIALQAAALTGTFAVLDSEERRAARRDALATAARLTAEIAELQRAGAKASQVARQVEINLKLQQARAELAAARLQL